MIGLYNTYNDNELFSSSLGEYHWHKLTWGFLHTILGWLKKLSIDNDKFLISYLKLCLQLPVNIKTENILKLTAISMLESLKKGSRKFMRNNLNKPVSINLRFKHHIRMKLNRGNKLLKWLTICNFNIFISISLANTN